MLAYLHLQLSESVPKINDPMGIGRKAARQGNTAYPP
jgi:hypothetical protein